MEARNEFRPSGPDLDDTNRPSGSVGMDPQPIGKGKTRDTMTETVGIEASIEQATKHRAKEI